MNADGRELHSLFEGRLRMYQYVNGYRFSIDTLLLAIFARERLQGHVADLGTGSGVLPVLLARSQAISALTGFEIQPELVALAHHNAELHSLGQRFRIEQADIKQIRAVRPAETFDAAVANPPFYREGSGKINPNAQDAAARHELLATLEDFITAAAYLIKNGGNFCSVFPAARCSDLLCCMRANRIEPKVLRCVHSHTHDPAVLILVQGAKNAGVQMTILPPLILYSSGQTYSPEVQSIFNSL